MIEQVSGESYISFVKRVIKAKKENEIDYLEMGNAILGEENVYSADNLRKAFYVLDKVCNKIEDKYDGKAGTRILAISDLHIPFQLPKETFIKYKNCVDILVINGDIIDLAQLSKFKRVRRNTPIEDIITTRQYLIDLIDYINPKSVIANYGNHEVRFQRYLQRSLENDLCELLPNTPLDLIFNDGFPQYDTDKRAKTWYEPLKNVFPEKEIIYTGEWWNQIGDTLFVHPMSYSSGMLKTSKRAMDYFLSEGITDFKVLCMAHTHRIAEADIGAIKLYETGCCCDVASNNYNDGRLVPTQKEGFIYLIQDKDGNTIREFTDKVVLN